MKGWHGCIAMHAPNATQVPRCIEKIASADVYTKVGELKWWSPGFDDADELDVDEPLGSWVGLT